MRPRLRSLRSIALAVVVAVACSDGTTPVTPVQVAGVYTLESVTGRGPESGTFTLTADGRAERHVRFAVTGAYDYVATGSFEIDAGEISFALIHAGTPSVYVWPVHGEWRGSSFTIRYPDPADGPDIVETYRRL